MTKIANVPILCKKEPRVRTGQFAELALDSFFNPYLNFFERVEPSRIITKVGCKAIRKFLPGK